MDKKKFFKFLGISLLGIILINLTFVSALIIFNNYGKITLSPGERYTLNIPFIGKTNNPEICGLAKLNNGSLLKDVTIRINSSDILEEENTNSTGGFCITLPEITGRSETYSISIEYDNSSNGFYLGNKSYSFDFDNRTVYNKTINESVFLTGMIYNEDAEIENGRISLKVGYFNSSKNNSLSYRYGDYQTFNVINIDPNKDYELTKSSSISWLIPLDDSPVGQYKMLIKTSFNGDEKSTSIVFNITE